MTTSRTVADTGFPCQALRLAQRAYGFTSHNPLVGTVLTKRGGVIDRGGLTAAGKPLKRECSKPWKHPNHG